MHPTTECAGPGEAVFDTPPPGPAIAFSAGPDVTNLRSEDLPAPAEMCQTRLTGALKSEVRRQTHSSGHQGAPHHQFPISH